MSIQIKRLIIRSLFFLLFIFAPIYDIFRFDLNLNNFIVFGHSWVLGIDNFRNENLDSYQIFFNMAVYFLLPLFAVIISFIFISWKWGRIYCAWLCPHFSIVELLNYQMRKTSGKLSIWDKKLPEQQKDGTTIKPNKKYWVFTIFLALLFAFIWAVVLLTYLLPPSEIYSNLFNNALTINQFRFILVATILFSIEFLFARHLFCRFGCAVGLFQSLIWMGNNKAMVIKFDKSRSTECLSCDNSCDIACPMRLKTRSPKNHKFSCTQCLKCVQACNNTKANNIGLLGL